MSTRFIITAICIGFLIGLWFGDWRLDEVDGLISVEIWVYQIKWGLTVAAIFGLLAAAYDAIPENWWQ